MLNKTIFINVAICCKLKKNNVINFSPQNKLSDFQGTLQKMKCTTKNGPTIRKNYPINADFNG